MPIFSLIFGVIFLIVLLIVAQIVCAIGQAIWTALCFGVVYLVRPEGKRAMWLVGTVPLFIPAYVIALIVLIWSSWPDKYTAYEVAFGSQPASTVTVLEGNVSGWGDSMEINLRFTASPADLQTLTAQGLTIDPNYANNTNGFVDTRFGPVSLAGKDIYTGSGRPQDFYNQDAILIYDPATGEAWYELLALD